MTTKSKRPTPLKKKPISGAEIIYRALEQEGVEYIFGHPGAVLLGLLDLFLLRSNMKHVSIIATCSSSAPALLD